MLILKVCIHKCLKFIGIQFINVKNSWVLLQGDIAKNVIVLLFMYGIFKRIIIDIYITRYDILKKILLSIYLACKSRIRED
jgi:hypothetical protein